jgi:hypothetical protein
VIGALHGSAAVSFKRIGDEVNANREMAEFSKYYPEGITDAEKKAFATIYGSVYLYLLDNIFKEFNMPQTIN